MGSAEEFNLRWNNHLNTISQLLGEFLNNKSLCDVTLSAEGQTISCHRVILAACSTYFQGIFNQVQDKSLVVMVKDAKFIDLKSLVDFMYYGEVAVEHDRLNSLLRTAESLKVKGLADEKKKEERIVDSPHIPQPAPQKRVMPSSMAVDPMAAKRQRVSAPTSFAQARAAEADGVQPKQEVVELDENDGGDYLEGDEKYDDDSNLSGAGPSGMESGLDDSGQPLGEGVEGQDGE